MTDIGGIPRALNLLADEANAAADAALVAALPQLDGSARQAALEMLLGRAESTALTDLVAGFNSYDPGLQALLVERVGDLFTAVRLATSGGLLKTRASAVELIRRSGNGKLAYLLAEALKARCPRTRELAAEALYDMAAGRMREGHAAQEPSRDSGQPSEADGLLDAVLDGVHAWEMHVQPKVLEAAAWLSDRLMPGVCRKLAEPKTKVARAFTDLLTGGAVDPHLAGFALRALAVPELRSAAAAAIAATRDPNFIEALVREGHLLQHAAIRAGCRRIRGVGWLETVAEMLCRLPEPLAEQAATLLSATGGTVEERFNLYRRLIDSGDEPIRRAVFMQLSADPADPATALIETIASRGQDPLAPSARSELRRRSAKGKPPAERQRRFAIENLALANRLAPEEASATRCGALPTTAGRHSQAAELEGWWQDLDPGEADRTRLLTASLRSSEADVLAFLQTTLRGNDSTERLKALRVIRALGWLAQVNTQVYRLAHDADSVVRSAAVAALAELPGPAGERILRAAVHDPDPRVQANAVEALDQLNVENRASVTSPKLDSPYSRVRANAAKSLLRLDFGRAGETLLDMLDDPARTHRISALWVVQRLDLRSLLDRITEMSTNDPDAHVRRRAARVMRHWFPDGRQPLRSQASKST